MVRSEVALTRIAVCDQRDSEEGREMSTASRVSDPFWTSMTLHPGSCALNENVRYFIVTAGEAVPDPTMKSADVSVVLLANAETESGALPSFDGEDSVIAVENVVGDVSALC